MWVWLWNASLRQNPQEAPGGTPTHRPAPPSTCSMEVHLDAISVMSVG